MINTPPSERPPPLQQPESNANNAPNHKAYAPDRNSFFRDDYSSPGSPRPFEEYAGGMIPAANALASLHHYKSGGVGSDWDAEGVSHFLVAPELPILLDSRNGIQPLCPRAEREAYHMRTAGVCFGF